jgi:hypothetical protein
MHKIIIKLNLQIRKTNLLLLLFFFLKIWEFILLVQEIGKLNNKAKTQA